MSVFVLVYNIPLFTSPILLLVVEAVLTALVFLECPRALDPCGLVGDLNRPSAVLLWPAVTASDKFGRDADVFVIGCAAAASCESCDNWDSCPSAFVL